MARRRPCMDENLCHFRDDFRWSDFMKASAPSEPERSW
jgi:hypothetical protein